MNCVVQTVELQSGGDSRNDITGAGTMTRRACGTRENNKDRLSREMASAITLCTPAMCDAEK